MAMKKLLCLLTLAALLAVEGRAQNPLKSSMHPNTLSGVVTNAFELHYVTYLPSDYEARPDQRWPLMLFLHGAGERGNDLQRVAIHGPLKLVQAGTNFPFIIVAPQCPANERWAVEPLVRLLDHVEATCRVDTNRVYLTGLSMGGFGTWSLGLKYPQRFAALVPICGGGNYIETFLGSPADAEALRTLPIWAFHGGKDPVVPVAESERMVKAVRDRAGNQHVKLTIYPDALHDAWTETYNNPQLYEWLLAQKRH